MHLFETIETIETINREIEFIKIDIPHIISKILNILCLMYKPDGAFLKIHTVFYLANLH